MLEKKYLLLLSFKYFKLSWYKNDLLLCNLTVYEENNVL